MPGFTSHFNSAADGLILHWRDYGDAASGRTPVVCLPGLARTSGDFGALAEHIAASGRRVLALDYRGRGLSGWDADPAHYDLATENADIQTVLAAAKVEQAVFVGTSRGGMHTMLLSMARPGLIRAAVLNDIGPVLESTGLARIKGYVGKLPQPISWAEATAMFKTRAGAQFPALSAADWETYARLTFVEKDGKLLPQYDPTLAENLAKIDLSKPLPDMWPLFEGLKAVPLLVLRGALSDLLSPQTVDEMARRHPRCETLTVPGQGHAPMLLDLPSIARIAEFVERWG